MAERYIWIVRWSDFQHYKPERDRPPAWIKTYTKQLDDDRYTNLSPRCRALLHDLRIAFGRTSGRLSDDTRTLSRRLVTQVRRSDLDWLNYAGLIEYISRTTLENRLEALYASRAPARSKEGEGEREREKGSNEATLLSPAENGFEPQALPFTHEQLYTRLLTLIGTHGDDNTPAVLRSFVNRATEGQLAKVLESAQQAHPRNRAQYVVAALRNELEETF